jgi:pimeloyl-ACP methyl ester carboxylesterase
MRRGRAETGVRRFVSTTNREDSNMLRHLLSVVLLSTASAAALADPWPVLADPCTSVRDRGALTRLKLSGAPGPFGTDTFYPSAFLGNEDDLDAIVFIVNANGAGIDEYRHLAEHLARQNYLVHVIRRPTGALEVASTVNRMDTAFQHFGLPDDFPAVLIGHSRGGGTVMEVTRQHGDAFNVRAVVNIAPNVADTSGFMGTRAPAYLALYGSQDEDMSGTAGTPREAFAGYDDVNFEGTTASAVNRFLVVTPNRVDKAMVYVRGADHSGFVNHPGMLLGGVNAHFDYLSVPDQFCIAKAYVTGFLSWQLQGVSGYRGMFYGDIVPPSVSSIVTAEPDFFGNPAGQPLQLFHQFSPKKRFVVADFESAPTLAVGAGMIADVIEPNAVDTRARHATQALHVGWMPSQQFRNVQLTVPANRRTLAAFERLQLRIGQISSGIGQIMNIPLQEPQILISLVDGGGQQHTRLLNDYGRIPFADRRQGPSIGHSHMNTIAIPMDDFTGIDLSDVRFVRFWVLPGTQGEVMIDGIEGVYDF